MTHQPAEVLGAPHPDWPDDLTTFEERSAYQRGVADARRAVLQTSRLGLPDSLEVVLQEPTLLTHVLTAERDDEKSNWYIRMTGPDGCYLYDGYWHGSVGKTHDEVISEAIRGAMLGLPK